MIVDQTVLWHGSLNLLANTEPTDLMMRVTDDPDGSWMDGTAVIPDLPCGEGAPAPACPRASTARDTASTDTGDNIADFACRTPSPGTETLRPG